MITVVGMGNELGDLTLAGADTIKSAKTVVVKTALTRTFGFFEEIGVSPLSFDELYENAEDFNDLNEKIVEKLLSLEGDVVYCVDGSGSDDKSVVALAERTQIRIVAGVCRSSGVTAFAPSVNFCEVSAYDYKEKPFVPAIGTLVIKDIDNSYLASDVKLALADRVGEEREIIFFEGKTAKTIPVFELDRQNYSYDTGVIVTATPLVERERFDFYDLAEILDVLRGKNGCPWDKVQTHESIRKNVMEEAYELCEAIDRKDEDMLEEESGDVLLQAAFNAKIAQDTGEFTMTDMMSRLCKKLINRHTHIFGGTVANNADEALSAWEAAKRTEKSQKSAQDVIDGIAKTFPALLRGAKLVKLARKKNVSAVEFSAEDLKTLAEKGEYAKLLFALTCVLQREGIDGEESLTLALNDLEKEIVKNEN